MSKQDIWMPLHIGDYLSDTMRLTTVQHGAYLLLLMQYWKSGPLTDDDDDLAGIVKMEPRAWAKIAPAIRRFFTIGEDGLLHQKRADAERAKTAMISEKRRRAVNNRADRKAGSDPQTDGDGGSDGDADGAQNGNKTSTSVEHLNVQKNLQVNTHARGLPQPQSNQEKEEPHSPPSTDAPAEPSPTDSVSRGSRLRFDWQPSRPEREFAQSLGLDAEAVAAEFRDYWCAVPGARGRKLDWPATFRNRCRERASMPARRLQPTENAAARRMRETAEAMHRMTYPERYAAETGPVVDHEPELFEPRRLHS